jgi:membrane protein
MRRGGKLWLAALRGVWNAMGDRNLGLIASGVAFWSMLAIFPGIAALIALWGYQADPSVVAAQLPLMRDFLPDEGYRLLSNQVNALVVSNVSTLGWTSLISTLVALWSARTGVGALIQGVNAISGKQNRGGVMDILMAFVLTFALMGVAIVALVSFVVLPIILAFVPLGPLAGLALSAVRWVVALGVVVMGIAVIYRYGLNRQNTRPRPRWFTPGLALAVGLWALASWSFSYYLSNFGNYNEIYGSIGAVIALLMWFYISAYVVLLGAALNAELEREKAALRETEAESETGEAEPADAAPSDNNERPANAGA